jgi:hypothetical protein
MGKMTTPCKHVVENVKENNKENIGVNRRIILINIINKSDVRLWTELKWLRICMSQ